MSLDHNSLKPLGLKPVRHDQDEADLSIIKPLDFAQHPEKIHLLLCATGSVATIKIPNIVSALATHTNLSICLIFTDAATSFLGGQSAEQPSLASLATQPNVDGIYFDADEWAEPWVRGSKILHIELRRWGDMLLVAPLSANELAKMAQGWADNLLLSVVRAWDTTGLIDPVREIRGVDVKWAVDMDGNKKKRILVAPSMNTAMWMQPVTKKHLNVLEDEWGVDNGGWFEVLQPMEKELACGDIGGGAMKDWKEIVQVVEDRLGLTVGAGR